MPEFVRVPRKVVEDLVDSIYSDWHRFAEEDDPEPDELQALRAALKEGGI